MSQIPFWLINGSFAIGREEKSLAFFLLSNQKNNFRRRYYMKKVTQLISIILLVLLSNIAYADDSQDQDLQIATRLSKAFSRVAESSFPTVVVIENLQSKQRVEMPQLPPEFERFFGRPMQPKANERDGKPFPVGFGSGVIIRENGYIVTNHHVIDKAEYLRVKLQDGTVYDNYADKDAVKIVGVDEQSDLAVLKIKDDGKKFKPLNFANSDDVSIGEWAIAIGAPFNYDYTLTVGIVSQKGRHNVFRNRIVENYIQTDASINPGNSGGPLLNIKGELIGINNFIANGGGVAANAGLGFAISSNIVKSISDQIVEGGKVSRPWLGIIMSDLSPNDRKNFGIEKGVLVKEVVKGQPAEKAGLQSGDVIMKIGKTNCNEAYDVQAAVLKYKPGEMIPLGIVRNQKEMEVKIVAVLRDAKVENLASGKFEREPNNLGLSLREADGSIVIQFVEDNSEAFEKGIKPGTKIVAVNRVPVNTIEEFDKILKNSKGESIMLKLSYQFKEYIEFLKVR